MTEAIYLEVSEKTEAAKKVGRPGFRLRNVEILRCLTFRISRMAPSVPSDTEKRREIVKTKIQDIYDNFKQNYGAPKITIELRKTGEIISERTVGHICAKWDYVLNGASHGRLPQKILISAQNYKISLMNKFNPDCPNAVWCSDITYIFWTINGFVYLTSIMDLFSRKIICMDTFRNIGSILCN